MKLRLPLSCVLLFLITISLPADAQSKKHKKLRKLIPASEKVIEETYTYVKSIDTAGVYVIRIYIPETQQITSVTRYSDEDYKFANGYSEEWYHDGIKKLEGNYINNRADGIWQYYHRSTGAILSKGQMVDGFKYGRWKFYDENGNISQVMNFIKDVREGPFVEYDSLKAVINSGEYKSDTIYTQIKVDTSEVIFSESIPFMKKCEHIDDLKERKNCSDQELLEHIFKNLKYPKEAKKHGLQGKTYARFIISEEGKISDIRILKTQCQGFADEVTRVIESLPDFSPAMRNGKAVSFVFTLPIQFRLEHSNN